MQLLSELRDKLTKSITVSVPLRDLNDEFITNFSEILNQNATAQPRNCDLRFNIFDTEENIAVDLPAKKIKINPNNEFLELLKSNNLNFKLQKMRLD